ncbi:MAG: hypothetical protein OXI51_02615 [Chloroflexota bacterium]|nr:hypothetical protein [Chloroflexota bacterium]
MTVSITVRNVPKHVRDELARRAARRGQSMQAFLLGELERIAAEPTVDELLDRVRKRVEESGTHIPASIILEARDADRT